MTCTIAGCARGQTSEVATSLGVVSGCVRMWAQRCEVPSQTAGHGPGLSRAEVWSGYHVPCIPGPAAAAVIQVGQAA
jgi:hypothetical protein